MSIGGLNRSSSQTNRRRRIKFLNLEAPGMLQFQLPDLNYDNSHTFFLFLFLSVKNFFIRPRNSKTTKARKLKFGDMISPYMKLYTCIFGGATSRGLRQTHQKLVITKFNT